MPPTAPAPPRPATYWLTQNYTNKARYHADSACDGLRWARERAEKHDHDPEDLLVPVPTEFIDEATDPRLLCRICALADATIRLLTTPDPTGRDVTVTVAAAAPGKTPSETAVERIRVISDATGLPAATHGTCGAVLYGVVPAHALDFLDRNFDISLPPPGMALDGDIVAAAWTLNRQLGDFEWEVAAAISL